MSAPNVSARFNILGAGSQGARPPPSMHAPGRLVPAYAPSREEWATAFPGRPFPAIFERRPPLPGDAMADPTEDECLNQEEISVIPTFPWKEAAARQREAWQEKKVEGDNCRTDDGEAMDCELDHDDERVENDDIGDGDDDDDDYDDDASVGTEPAQGDGADQDVSMSISDEFCCDVCQMEYDDDDEVKVLPCNHFFHTECVSKWLKVRATCPLCRFNFKPPPEKPAPPMIRTSSGSMVNAAPLYVPISGDFEATETRRVRVEEASDAGTNLQDAELVQALGGFVASGEVVLSSGPATAIPAFAVAPTPPSNPSQPPPTSTRPSVSPTFAPGSTLPHPARPVRAVTATASPPFPSTSPTSSALSPVFVSTPPPNHVSPSLSHPMPSIGISPPAVIASNPISSLAYGGRQSFGALSMASFAPQAPAASRGLAPVFVAEGM